MAEQSNIIRVFIIAGSSRRVTNCPAADSKSGFFAQRAKELLPRDWIVDVFNVANDFVLPKIQSCNACVSTSMALCVWPCNCYEKHSYLEPDLMWDEDIYARIYAADAIIVCAPVNWYGPTSSVKMLFDRLICANGGNPDETLINHKDGTLAAKLENSPAWRDLSLNHLEGRTAAFFVYGDNGGDEIAPDGRPMILKHKEYFDPEGEGHFNSPAHAYGPIIWQCRYSGIEVPAHLIKGIHFGLGGKYSNNQIPHLKEDKRTLAIFDEWLINVQEFVQKKGKVPEGKYPVSLTGADSDMPMFRRQMQLLFRTVLGELWLHSLGYFTSRSAARKLRLYKE